MHLYVPLYGLSTYEKNKIINKKGKHKIYVFSYKYYNIFAFLILCVLILKSDNNNTKSGMKNKIY